MTRMAMLRAGYGALGLAFAMIAATYFAPGLILAGLGVGFVAGILLAFSDDDLPKWAGIALVVYFLLTVLAFFATTSITINRGGENFYFAPPNVQGAVLQWIGIASPIMLAGGATAAVWERENAPRALAIGALAGMVLFAILSVALTLELDPTCATDALAPGCEGAAQRAAAQADQQGDMLGVLSAVSAFAGAIGALWAASRPDSLS